MDSTYKIWNFHCNYEPKFSWTLFSEFPLNLVEFFWIRLFVDLILSQSTTFQLCRNRPSWVELVLSKDKCVLLNTQWCHAGEARTHGPSVSSQALYHWATVLPWIRLSTESGLNTKLMSESSWIHSFSEFAWNLSEAWLPTGWTFQTDIPDRVGGNRKPQYYRRTQIKNR